MGVGQESIMPHDLRRRTGAVGAVLRVGWLRTDGHIIVVPCARSWDLLLQLVFMLVEVEGKRGQIITPHELLDRGAGGGGEEAAGQMPDDPMPLGSPGLGRRPRATEKQSCQQQPYNVTRYHGCPHRFLSSW